MPAKKASKQAPPRKATASETPRLVHAIGALLHTMRCIAQHEDQLCTLLHAAKSGAVAEANLHAELLELLDKMPAHEYTNDLDALYSHLSAAGDAH